MRIFFMFIVFGSVLFAGINGAEQDFSRGNYKDALKKYRAVLFSSETAPIVAADALVKAKKCLDILNLIHEWDELCSGTLKASGGHWRTSLAASELLGNIVHSGHISEQKFFRGWNRRGEWVNVTLRDRAYSIKLLSDAIISLESDAEASVSDKCRFYSALAAALSNYPPAALWKLQLLTDVSRNPEWKFGSGDDADWSGAPVDTRGEPLFYGLPSGWKNALNDGERFRWALSKVAENGGGDKAALHYARFLRVNFGVSTLMNGTVDSETIGSILSLAKLSDDESIARLATGIKRFRFPQEHSYIRIYKGIPASSSEYCNARIELGQIYCNRRQYVSAAECFKAAADAGKGSNTGFIAKERYDEITGERCEISTNKPLSAGKTVSFTLRYRNAKEVSLRAWKVDMQGIVAFVRKIALDENERSRYFLNGANNPAGIITVDEKGNVLPENKWRFLAGKAVEWKHTLAPKTGHCDTYSDIKLPFSEPGVYFVEAKTADGASRKIIVAEAAKIVSKNIRDAYFWQILKSADGSPAANVKVNLTAWNRKWEPRTKKWNINKFSDTFVTDENGCLYLDKNALQKELHWDFLLDAELGEAGYVFFQSGYFSRFNQVASVPLKHARQYAVTDRPVYHPGDKVHFKVWLTDAKYGEESRNSIAGTKQDFKVRGPDYGATVESSLICDDFGGVETSWVIPVDAKLGVYRFGCGKNMSGRFRVEEYRKPEYEVDIATPEKALVLGEKTQIKVRAKYYFGMPVTDANVSVRIERTRINRDWWPVGPWDWLYDNGYSWLQVDCPWYPGWRKWGMAAPRPFIGWKPASAPELVCSVSGKLSEDGTFAVELDTLGAKMLFPEDGHSYRITAEVRDKSGRTVVGNGTVTASARPFDMYVRPDRGFYSAGERMKIDFIAHAQSGHEIEGKGTAKLFRVKYDDSGTPSETLLFSENVIFEDGIAAVDWTADRAGQYRISCTLAVDGGGSVEGAALVTVRDSGKDIENAGDFRWNELELVPDRSEYGAGDTVRLAVNTAQRGSVVMLFPRAENGVCGRPVILRLPFGSIVYELPVTAADMPGIIVEAYTVSGGRVHNVVRRIAVPPVKRVLDVEVVPSAKDVRPGAEEKLNIRVKGIDGRPVSGSVAVAVYDRSLDAVAGDCVPGDIRESFWKWRRHHRPGVTELIWRLHNILLEGESSMAALGMFENMFSNVDAVASNGPMPRTMKLGVRGEAAAPMMASVESASMEVGAVAPKSVETAGIKVRSDFSDMALWSGHVMTGMDGRARLDLKLPDSLASWKVCVWAVDRDSDVGYGSTEIITSKDLMVRLALPRFLTEKDDAVISALVNSKLPGKTKVDVTLEIIGDGLVMKNKATDSIFVEHGRDGSCSWNVSAVKPGKAKLRVRAVCSGKNGRQDGDAMETEISIAVHGTEKLISMPGMLTEEDREWSSTFTVPEQISAEGAELTVNWSPSLALAMVDALPYLIDFEYSGTEQTLNRFLPAVAVCRTLKKLGMDLSGVASHSANLNPVQLGDYADRRDRFNARLNDKSNAVFDEAVLERITADNMKHLIEMQCSDGGWGWFGGYGERSWTHTTLQVVGGLLRAREYGIKVDEKALGRGLDWLKQEQGRRLEALRNKSRATALDAYMYHVLSGAGMVDPALTEFLWRDKNELPVLGKVLFGLGLQKNGDARLEEIMTNIRQFAVYDNENQTAYLRIGSEWWRWHGDENETMAKWLTLLVRDGKDRDTPPRLVKYLLNNRKQGSRWRSTRDTAACLEAFAEYVASTGEGREDVDVEVLLNGKKVAESRIKGENVFNAKLSVKLNGIGAGKHRLTVRKRGNSMLYVNGYAVFFSMEDFIEAAGLDVKIQRNVYRIRQLVDNASGINAAGNIASKKVLREEKELLRNGDVMKSGELFEVELVIESKNDYEYMLIEDMLAAGTEPVEARSGYDFSGLGAYVEYRTGKTAAFLRSLNRGKSVFTYRLRAVTPGKYSALPAILKGVYAPELRGNSDEMKLGVRE